MRVKTRQGISKKDSHYLTLIDDYLRRIKAARLEMRRSKAEIEKLKNASRRKLAEIDALLKAC